MADPTGTPAPTPWFQGADTETVAYVQNRGLDKLEPGAAALKAIEAHRNAEKQLGWPADKLARLPKDDADQATRDALFNRLGRPEAADKYDWTGIEADDKFKAWASGVYHKLGLSQSQVTGLLRDTIARMQSEGEEGTKAETAAMETERLTLIQKWGGNADANLAIARNAYEKLGFNEKQVQAMESQVGFAQVMSMFHNLGTKLGEDAYIKGESTNGVMSREQASVRIGELKKDEAFVKRYMAGDVNARKEMTDLHTIASAA